MRWLGEADACAVIITMARLVWQLRALCRRAYGIRLRQHYSEHAIDTINTNHFHSACTPLTYTDHTYAENNRLRQLKANSQQFEPETFVAQGLDELTPNNFRDYF